MSILRKKFWDQKNIMTYCWMILFHFLFLPLPSPASLSNGSPRHTPPGRYNKSIIEYQRETRTSVGLWYWSINWSHFWHGFRSLYALGNIRSNSAIDATAARRAQVRQQYSQRGRLAGMSGQSIAGGWTTALIKSCHEFVRHIEDQGSSQSFQTGGMFCIFLWCLLCIIVPFTTKAQSTP